MRSTLKSCSFGSYKGKDGIPEEVLRLLSSLKPEMGVEYVQEIIDAGLDGRINLDGNFNLGGYVYAIKRNGQLSERKEMARESHINFSSDGDTRSGETRQEAGMVDANVVAYKMYTQMNDSFENLVEDADLRYAIETIKSINEELVITYDVDLIVLLKKAASGVPQAVAKLKQLCDDFALVREQVKIVLSSGKPIEECFC